MKTNATQNWQGRGFTAMPMTDVRLVAALEPKYQGYNIRPDTMPGSASKGEAQA